MYKGSEVKPMDDFWIDCYSTAIFSILLSNCPVEKAFIYNNNYIYQYDRNDKKDLGRVYVKMLINDLVDHLLINKEVHNFFEDQDIVSSIKHYLDKSKIVLLGIDMFYGITDTSQWHKHHVKHYILVKGYDDEKGCMYLMETGEQGYMEYTLSYEDIAIAAGKFVNESYVYDITNSFSMKIYNEEELKANAKTLISSIDTVLTHRNDIWHVTEDKIMSMKDEIETHLKSMWNRQKVNGLLFKSLEGTDNKNEYVETFEKLEANYKSLRELFIQSCVNNIYDQNEKRIIDTFVELLSVEKRLWEKFISK